MDITKNFFWLKTKYDCFDFQTKGNYFGNDRGISLLSVAGEDVCKDLIVLTLVIWIPETLAIKVYIGEIKELTNHGLETADKVQVGNSKTLFGSLCEL